MRAVAAVIGCDIHPLNNLALLSYLRTELGRGQETVGNWYRHWIREGFAAVDALIGDTAFCFGETPGMADIWLVPQVYNANRFNLDLGPFPRISAINECCLALEAFDKARPENQPDAE